MGQCCGSDKADARFQSQGPLCTIVCVVFLYIGITGTLTFQLSMSGLVLCALQVMGAFMLASELVERSHPTAPWLMVLGASVTTVALAVGTVNYHAFYAPYLDASSGREYKGLRATDKASTHSDGGIIDFGSDALLDGMRSFGRTSHGRTYCVVPVTDTSRSGEDKVPTIQFWAVGMDCCGTMGTFSCGSAGDPGPKSGVVLHASDDMVTSSILRPHSHQDEFYRAVESAVVLHELKAAQPPLLMIWSSDPQKMLTKWLHDAIAVWLGSSAIVCVVAAIAWCPLDKFYADKIKNASEGARPPAAAGAGGTRRADPFLTKAA
jgi:hypothetical protein